VGYSCAPWLQVILLHFSRDQSNWSFPSSSSTTFQNFSGVSDPLPEASKFQHHIKLYSKCMNITLKNKCRLYVIIAIRLFSITICNLLIFPSYFLPVWPCPVITGHSVVTLTQKFCDVRSLIAVWCCATAMLVWQRRFAWRISLCYCRGYPPEWPSSWHPFTNSNNETIKCGSGPQGPQLCATLTYTPRIPPRPTQLHSRLFCKLHPQHKSSLKVTLDNKHSWTSLIRQTSGTGQIPRDAV